MNPSYIPIIMMLVLVFLLYEQNKIRSRYAAKLVNRKNNLGESLKMKELAERFLGKECIIYTFDSKEVIGTLKEVIGGAILLERTDSTEAINLEFVVRIRDYPRKKDGKKKSIFV